MTNIFPQTLRLQLSIALVAQGPPAVFDEAQIGEFYVAVFAAETARVPVGVHRFDYAADDELPAFPAARCEQHLEVVLAVLPPFEFEEGSVFENLETLRAPMYDKRNDFILRK